MIEFLPEAQAEVDAAIAWYEEQHGGLGLEFLNELLISLERLDRSPELQQIILPGDIRRALLRKFPYGVLFRPSQPRLIIAVMHLHRDPGYWQERL